TNGRSGAAAALATSGRARGETDGQVSFVSPADQFALFQADAPSCDRCGSITVRSGNCYLCYNCGHSMGCS
ncbi:MAG TPA: hypothetical protein EYH34_17330, partial [Planctomycetes bacterium]|nr:hypothetical protein [Planctomycetota bacterium]